MADIQNLPDSYFGLERILYAIQQHEVPTNISKYNECRIDCVEDIIHVRSNCHLNFVVKRPYHHNTTFNIAAVYGIIESYCCFRSIYRSGMDYTTIIGITLAILNYQSTGKKYTTADIYMNDLFEVIPCSDVNGIICEYIPTNNLILIERMDNTINFMSACWRLGRFKSPYSFNLGSNDKFIQVKPNSFTFNGITFERNNMTNMQQFINALKIYYNVTNLFGHTDHELILSLYKSLTF
jgi:hypothetical protein